MYAKDNPDSWRQIHEFVDGFPDDHPYWQRWKPMVRAVLSELEHRGLDSAFRVGQSMHHIVISTLDHHGLNDEPRVTLEFDVDSNSVRVAYSDGNLYFCEPMSQDIVPLLE